MRAQRTLVLAHHVMIRAMSTPASKATAGKSAQRFLLAHELGSLTFGPKRIKDELYSRRQMQKGHRITRVFPSGVYSS